MDIFNKKSIFIVVTVLVVGFLAYNFYGILEEQYSSNNDNNEVELDNNNENNQNNDNNNSNDFQENETSDDQNEEEQIDVEKITYTVKFNTDGGNKIKSQSIEENEKATKPTNPKKNGYTFVEWQLNGKKYNFNKEVTKDITLKAKWQKVETTPLLNPTPEQNLTPDVTPDVTPEQTPTPNETPSTPTTPSTPDVPDTEEDDKEDAPKNIYTNISALTEGITTTKVSDTKYILTGSVTVPLKDKEDATVKLYFVAPDHITDSVVKNSTFEMAAAGFKATNFVNGVNNAGNLTYTKSFVIVSGATYPIVINWGDGVSVTYEITFDIEVIVSDGSIV